MKYSEATQGRTFIVRLEDGDILHESVERLATEKGVKRATVIALGGADSGSRLVVGPREGRAPKIVPMEIQLDDVHEIAGVGTIFPDANNVPVLHMHIACGRGEGAKAGCIRRGVKIWHVMEVIIMELLNTSSHRALDKETGFELLQP